MERKFKHLKTGKIYYLIRDDVINCTNANDEQVMVMYRRCPNKFSRKAEGVSENLRVARRKGEHSNGAEEAAVECDTRLYDDLEGMLFVREKKEFFQKFAECEI